MAVTEMARIETKARKLGLGTFFTLTFVLTWGIAAMSVLMIASALTVLRRRRPTTA